MSYLKDAKIIKTIAENENFGDLSEEACRYILSNTELLLRKLVIETAKIVRKFNRGKIQSRDIQIVLSNANMTFLSTGASRTIQNNYIQTEDYHFELDQNSVLIKDCLVDILKTKLLKKKKIEIDFDWLFINGSLKSKNEPNHDLKQIEMKNQRSFPGENGHSSNQNLQEFCSYDYFTDKNSRVAYLIKEVNPNVLTKEANNFFETFREILEGYFEKIDNCATSIDYKRFNYSPLKSAFYN